MQERPPHNIRRFADGETIPEGWRELTEEEFRELDAMTPDQRGKWLEEQGTDVDPFHDFKKEINETREKFEPGHFERKIPMPQPPPVKRQHRRQNR